jgi:hypothetical protein
MDPVHMSISSLVLDVAEDATGSEALRLIAADARFTIGPANGTRHAIVLDTPSVLEDTDAFDWLRDLPGIRLVTLVSAYLDDEALPAGAAANYL